MSQPAESVEPLRQRWHQLLAPFAPPADVVEDVWRSLADAHTGPESCSASLRMVRSLCRWNTFPPRPTRSCQ